MIVFCGDSFCMPDDFKWSWMSQVAAHYDTDFITLGKLAVSNLDILCQVEHAIENHAAAEMIVVSLTTPDRLEYDESVSNVLTSLDYDMLRNDVLSFTLSGLIRRSIVPATAESLGLFASFPVNLKRSEIYIEHIINKLTQSGIPFRVFSNIFPVWRNSGRSDSYTHKLDYIVDGPANYISWKDIVPLGEIEGIDQSILDRRFNDSKRSCHMTLPQSTLWAHTCIKYIDSK